MLSALLLCSLAFFSCSGTGGVADSEDETYGSSAASGSGGSVAGSSAGGKNGSSGGDLDAWEIMQRMDSGHADEVVAILSGDNTDPVVEERGTFEVVLPASSMGLTEGCWVELEIAGDADYKGKAFAGSDGNVRFTVPRQRVGAVITVTLTAYLPDGTEEGIPYTSGSKTGEVEAGGEYSFTVPLVDLPRVTIDITGTKSSYGRTVEQDGVSYDVIEYTGSGLGMSVTNSDSEATMDIKLNDNTASESQSLSDGFNKIEVTAVKSEALPPVVIKKNVYVVKALSEDDIEITFTGDEGYGNDSDGYSYVKYSYINYDNLQVSVTNNYTGDSAGTGENSTMAVTVSGGASYSGDGDISDMVLNDGHSTITVTLTKPLCNGVEKEMKINAHMKKIKATATAGKINIGNNTKLSGTVYLGGREVRSFDKTSWTKNKYDQYNFKEGYNSVYYFTEKTDSLHYYTTGLKAGGDDLSDADRKYSMSEIKSQIKSSGYLYANAFGSGGTTDHEMYMTLVDVE